MRTKPASVYGSTAPPATNRPLDTADFCEREKRVRRAVDGFERIAARFVAAARYSLPFMARYRASFECGPTQRRLMDWRGAVSAAVVAVDGDVRSEVPFEAGDTYISERDAQCDYAVILRDDDHAAVASIGINSNAIAFFVEGALGGSSPFWEEEQRQPEMSAVQRAVVGEVMHQLAGDFAKAIRDEIGANMSFLIGDSKHESDRIDRDVIAVDCTIAEFPVRTTVTIAVAFAQLDDALRLGGSRYGIAKRERLPEQIAAARVDVAVELGRLTMPLSRVGDLKVGDVIRLPTSTDAPLVVRVAGIEKFLAKQMTSQGQVAVRVEARHAATELGKESNR